MSELWATALSYIVPNLATILTVLGFLIKTIASSKATNKKTAELLDEKINKIKKMETDVAITKAKVESIEKHLIEKER